MFCDHFGGSGDGHTGCGRQHPRCIRDGSSPERQPLEVRFREASSPEEERRKRPRKRLLTTDGESILKGVIWHEILKKPKGW
ncbi:hypothetical protein CSW47_01615 [Thermus scotoductus]|uniref:Uncharacterized protein n=1 Tax=Thermus scotoductus TaxID=37636 RepID=A0A430RGW9_THESC|nr:hypothetical protein CSW47_01615 [Thermus scotoductus]